MTRHMISRAASLFFGGAQYNRAYGAKAGIPLTPLYAHNFGAPAAADPDGAVTTQDLTALGVFSSTGIAGALAAAGVATFDVPRNVVAAWTGAAVITITGTDQYGEIIKESSASGTALAGKKAFKTITAVAVGADVTGLTVGSGDVLGLPFRVDANGLLFARANNAIDAGVFVPAVTTSPATALTGDVRGTFDPAVALNAANTVQVGLVVANPATKIGAYGVAQFGG